MTMGRFPQHMPECRRIWFSHLSLLRNYSVIMESNEFLGQKYTFHFFYSTLAGAPEFTAIKNVLALHRNHVGIQRRVPLLSTPRREWIRPIRVVVHRSAQVVVHRETRLSPLPPPPPPRPPPLPRRRRGSTSSSPQHSIRQRPSQGAVVARPPPPPPPRPPGSTLMYNDVVVIVRATSSHPSPVERRRIPPPLVAVPAARHTPRDT